MLEVDYDRLASDFLRALRGKRSQRAFSRRLRYRTNVSYTWESGRCFPTASRALWVGERAGVDVHRALTAFLGPAHWLEQVALVSPSGVVRLLEELRGRRSILDVAGAMQKSRFAVARWLHGEAEPRLPDFLRLVEVCSLRLLDFLATMVDPTALPTVSRAWDQLETMRRAAYEVPWSHAVLRALELRAYAELPRHTPGWIASRIGITSAEEQRCLDLLLETGQIRKEGARYALARSQTVDTRRDPRVAQKIKVWWSDVAVGRLRDGAAGASSYNLFTVSDADFERLRELHRAYFQQMRAIIEASQPCDRVVIACAQMLELAPP